MTARLFRLSIAVWALSQCSWGQAACATQVRPLKPTEISCPNATLTCQTGADPMRGVWVWSCPGTSQPATQIPLGVIQPQIMLPSQAERRVLENRQLELQNRAIEQQLRQQEAEILRLQQEVAARKAEAERRAAEAEVRRKELEGPKTTNGFINGRGWALLSETSKKAFLIGYREGTINMALSAIERVEDFKQAVTTYWPESADQNEIVAYLDNLYAKSENLVIPIPDGLFAMALKLDGYPEEQLTKFISERRARAVESRK